MFYKYEIRKIGNKRVLYIHMSCSYEEANEFIKKDNMSIEKKILEFIRRNNIDYNEGPVYIITNGITIKSLDIFNRKISVEELIGLDSYSNDKFVVKIEKDNIINTISLEDFLISTLLTNISIETNDEVLKCLSVLYRTYAYNMMNKKGYIKEDDSFINYKSLSYYKMLYFNNYEEIVSKLKQIISETDYTFITYNNLFINPYIHIVNNGHTDKKENVPYLQEIKSLWDLLSPLYLHRTVYKTEEIANIFNTSKENILNMKITSITPNGCIKNIKIGNTLYDGESFINKLNLPSLDITIIIDSENISFINRGNGNNLGLSIEGSKYLANVGCNYLQILNYYFPKCRIKKYAK